MADPAPTANPSAIRKLLKSRIAVWVLIGLGFVGGQMFAARDTVRGVPPALPETTIDGVAPADLSTTGRPSLIYFWASWCSICAGMRETINHIAADHPIVSVAMQSGDAKELQTWRSQNDFRAVILADESGAISRRYGLRGVPAAFILGRDGTIHSVTLGYTTEWGLRARLWLAERF